MKRKILYVTLGTALCVALCCCKNNDDVSKANTLFEENPVTVNWKDDSNKEITSFETND